MNEGHVNLGTNFFSREAIQAEAKRGRRGEDLDQEILAANGHESTRKRKRDSVHEIGTFAGWRAGIQPTVAD
jgi:hypothetical protein